jgi:HEAT repeat protein
MARFQLAALALAFWAGTPSESRAQTLELQLEIEIRLRTGGVESTPSSTTIPSAVAALKSKDIEVRRAAIHDLDRLLRAARADDPDVASGVGAILACLAVEERPDLKLLAARTVGRIGEAGRPAVPALRKLMKDDPEFVGVFAASALGRIDPSARRESLAFLRWRIETPMPEESKLPYYLMLALSDLGPSAREMGPDVARLMSRLDVSGRFRTIRALRDIGADQEEVVSALTAVVLDDRLPYREMLAETGGRALLVPLATGRFGRDVPTLEQFLQGVAEVARVRQMIRRDAILALTAIGPKAKAAVPALKQLTYDAELRPHIDKALLAIEGAR